MDELITIIVPVYNVDKYLKKCLESIIYQSYSNIEIILVNDKSSDNSLDICNDFIKKDKRIILINNKNNQGVSYSRNVGIENAHGKFITFVDSDDYIEKKYIEELYKMCVTSNSDISICGLYNEYECSNKKFKNNKRLKKKLYSNEAINKMLNERSFYANVWAKMYKTDIIKNLKFDIKLKIGEDLKFNYQAFKRAKIVEVDTYKILYHYLIRKNSATGKKFGEEWEKEIKLCEEIINDVKKNNKKTRVYAIKRYVRINYSCMLKTIQDSDVESYYKLRNNILNYKNDGIYKKFNILEKIKLFMVLHDRKLITKILN